MRKKCGACEWVRDEPRARPVRFTVHGVEHSAPDIWLAGRSSHYERQGFTALPAYIAAIHDYAHGCQLHLRYEAQRQAARR